MGDSVGVGDGFGDGEGLSVGVGDGFGDGGPVAWGVGADEARDSDESGVGDESGVVGDLDVDAFVVVDNGDDD